MQGNLEFCRHQVALGLHKIIPPFTGNGIVKVKEICKRGIFLFQGQVAEDAYTFEGKQGFGEG